LPRHLAAIAVAAERGINISKFASTDDLAAIRQSAINAAPPPLVVRPEAQQARAPAVRKGRARRPARGPQLRGTTVFIVHGRDLAARDAVFAFVRSIGLQPLEWTQALRLTKKGSPYVGEILDAAFRVAAAIIVLITPDEEARLKPEFVSSGDTKQEGLLSGQARPNVLFEAGMAFGRNANSTILVQLGVTRPFSDVGGRHVLHLSDNPASRQEFVTKLNNAGCIVNTSGTDWLSAGSFTRPLTAASTLTRRRRRLGQSGR
jgi:predicted nucleotide-binding protein